MKITTLLHSSLVKHIFILIGLVSVIFLIIYGFAIREYNNESLAATIKVPRASISIDAFIGEYRFTLFGYTSPKALVTLDGMGIFDQTYANDSGYFEFHNRFSPQAPREACLTATDQLGRSNTPTCLPPFPTKYDTTIGPILLPPSISLNKNEYYMGDEVIASGQTIPNTDVSFSTFIDEQKSIFNFLSWGFVKPVEAFTFPQLTTKSDEKGNYSLSLPSQNPSYFRLFSQSNFQKSDTPKSNGLNLKIYPVWMIIIHTLSAFFSILKNRLLEFIVLSECLLLALFLIRRYFHPHLIARSRALTLLPVEQIAIVQHYYPAVEENKLTVHEKYPIIISTNQIHIS